MTSFRAILSAAVTTTLVATAVLIGVLVVRREFFAAKPAVTDEVVRAAAEVFVPNWEQYLTGGHTLGSPSARVKILEFGDFQCPACRRFALYTVPALRRRYPDDVALVFRHWPLEYHGMAYTAARAAECAADQARFEAMYTILYEQQDSLARKPMTSFGRDSRIPNHAQFATCLTGRAHDRTIDRDIAAATAVGGTGTPTIVINGKRLSSTPDTTQLFAIVDAALAAAKGRQ